MYITPQLNVTYNRVWRFLFRHVPLFYKVYRFLEYYYVDSTILLYHKMAWFSAFHRLTVYFVTWLHRFWQLPFHRELRRKTTPDYEIAARRIVLSDTYYPALKRPNVTLHRDPIRTVGAKTIETEDGSKQEVDILVYATGFVPINFPVGYWKGRGGIDIAENWGESPTTYYGTCVPNAPNFFLIWGPNSGIFHHSLTSTVEIQVMFAINAISYMMEKDIATMEIQQKAADAFMEMADRKLERTIFTTKYRPKFVNSQGKCRAFWWGSCFELWWHLKDVHPERFDVKKRGEGKSTKMPNGVPEKQKRAPIEE
ncbi:hypothetical protein BGX34_008871 [Mortierella sp. NVP85]|nr:hypothetical protein BGX34_008871 [Mortierella sp. NVP85]